MTPLRSLLLVGAIGGIVGTAAMTGAMRRLYRLLPAEEHYPLPPRELTERIVPAPSPDATADRTLAAHFGFGAAAGALMSAAGGLGPGRGAVMGPAVWLLSYLGWVPATGLLRPRHIASCKEERTDDRGPCGLGGNYGADRQGIAACPPDHLCPRPESGPVRSLDISCPDYE